MTLIAIHVSTVLTVLIVIALILAALMVFMYFYGRKLSRQQAELQPKIDASTQDISMLIIDKKQLSIDEAIAAGLPSLIKDQTPIYLRWQKLPVVKAKIGPRMMTLIADPKVFEVLPLKKECKCSVSGSYYIRAIKSVPHGSIPKAPEKKKGLIDRARDMVGNKK